MFWLQNTYVLSTTYFGLKLFIFRHSFKLKFLVTIRIRIICLLYLTYNSLFLSRQFEREFWRKYHQEKTFAQFQTSRIADSLLRRNRYFLSKFVSYTFFTNEIIVMCRILLFKNYDNKNVNINWNVNLTWKFSTEKPIAAFQTIRLNCCQTSWNFVIMSVSK